MGDKFRTVLKLGQAEIVEKKSRFIANVKPVKTEEEAKAFIEEIKKKYWDARHNVFAYQIGEKNEIQRFSDDGEPQGTAGMPVLNVLVGEGIKNCCIVVTRYFGGTLLGTGGLVRAYGKSAKEGLIEAEVAEVGKFLEVSIVCDYSLQGKIQHAIMQAEHVIKEVLFTHEVDFLVFVEEEKVEDFQEEITNISSASANFSIIRKMQATLANGVFAEIE